MKKQQSMFDEEYDEVCRMIRTCLDFSIIQDLYCSVVVCLILSSFYLQFIQEVVVVDHLVGFLTS